MNWDDLRFAVAVHQAGSYAAASTRLKVDETTIARRVARLQRDLGVTLFEAVDGRRQATAQGREILKKAALMDHQARDIEASGNLDAAPVRTIRIATTDSIAVGVLAPDLPDLLNTWPNLTIQFLASTENVNFSRWEADLAIRLRKPEKGDFIVSRVAAIRMVLIRPVSGGSGEHGPLVYAYPEDLDLSPESRFLAAAGLKETARCVTKNLLVAEALLATGKCIGILPDFLCTEFRDGKKFVLTEVPEARDAWLLLQPHLKADPQIRSVIDWVREAFRKAGSRTGSTDPPSA